jgi:lysozyme
MDRNRLKAMLRRHEGERLKPYKCTAGYLTIGIGRNLEGKGITQAEAEYLLSNDIDECVDDLRDIFPLRFDQFPDHVQEVLVNMRFQLGSAGFWNFEKLRAAVWAYDFQKAAEEMLNSKWAKHDTPGRAKELAGVMRHGFNKS